MSEIELQIKSMAANAKQAARRVATLDTSSKNAILHAIADGLVNTTDTILAANAKDIADADENGLSAAMKDRLLLTPKRIASIADAVRQIAKLQDPVGEVIDEFTGAQNIAIKKVR